MFKIRTLNNIAEVGLKKLGRTSFDVSDIIDNPDGIVLRSFDMHQMELPKSLIAVARAGAGTNNIPIDECSEKGIVVFNTPGGNANAVKELVLASLLISSRDIIGGAAWVNSLLSQDGSIDKAVEAGKKKFAGPELMGKRLGVIGLGAIGVLVCNAATALGMEVMGFDPFLSVDAAWHLSSDVTKAYNLDDLVESCDYITLHVPLNDGTRGLFNAEMFAKAKKGLRLLNLARGELVDTQAVKDAIDSGIVAKYVTDFADRELVGCKNVITTPHIGASTPESEDNCAVMACSQLREFLETGNIKNSVNFPNCEIPYTGKYRVAIAHRNVPSMIGSISAVFAKENINIDNMINKSKGPWAYTLIVTEDLLGSEERLHYALSSVNNVVSVRIIPKRGS